MLYFSDDDIHANYVHRMIVTSPCCVSVMTFTQMMYIEWLSWVRVVFQWWHLLELRLWRWTRVGSSKRETRPSVSKDRGNQDSRTQCQRFLQVYQETVPYVSFLWRENQVRRVWRDYQVRRRIILFRTFIPIDKFLETHFVEYSLVKSSPCILV